MRMLVAVAVVVTAPAALAEQPKGPDMSNPISASLKFNYERVAKFLAAAADEMPPEQYGYKPTAEVRSFAQLIGHVIDASWMFCSAAKKEPAPKKTSVEKTVTDKAGLKKALAEVFTYCDAVYAASTDATLSTPVDLFAQKMPKFSALDINIAHANEHYGNIVTYL